MIKRTALFYPLLISAALVTTALTYAADVKTIPFEEKHKDKSAIKLADDMTIELKEDWSFTMTSHDKVKILKEDAKSYGEFPITYERDKDKITNIKACSITPDGKTHKYSKVQDLAIYEGYPMYSDSKVKMITLPEVNIGSILEVEYTMKSKGFSIKDAFWWYISLDPATPTKELNRTITLPKKLNIQYKDFNLKDKPPVITETDSTITYSWHLENMDGQTEEEEYTPPPTPESTGSGAEFSSIRQWGDVSDWYYSLVQKNMIINKDIEEAAKKAVEGKVTLKDKVRAVLEYVQDNFRYVSMSFGANTLEPHPTNEVFRNKYGDCKDLSLLTMALLKVVGVKSYIALCGNEFSMSDPQYDLPLPSLFDHALLLVEDLEGGGFYIDPLLNGYDIGQYPVAYQAAYTFIINEKGGRFGRFPIFDEKRTYTKQNWVANLEEDGSAITESESLWDLDFSIKTRDMVKAMNDEERKNFFQSVETYVASGGEILERRIDGMESRYGQIKSYVKIKRPNLFPVINDMMIIDLGGYDRGYEFAKQEREGPIFAPVNSLSETTATYHIPKGFKVTHLPKDQTLDIGFFSVIYHYQKKKDEVITTEITRCKRLELPKEEYKKIKSFFDQLPQKTEQRIILKKSKPLWGLIDWFKGLWAKIKALVIK